MSLPRLDLPGGPGQARGEVVVLVVMRPMHRRSLHLLATWFGSGLSPRAPGTCGTLAAIPLWFAFTRLQPMTYLYATLGFTVFAIVVAHAYETVIANGHDPSEIVIDEVAGFLVTMAWLPPTWTWLAAGFVTFRVFDALKPFPISWMDHKIEGGVGTVADDLAAGIISNVLLQFVWQRYFG